MPCSAHGPPRRQLQTLENADQETPVEVFFEAFDCAVEGRTEVRVVGAEGRFAQHVEVGIFDRDARGTRVEDDRESERLVVLREQGSDHFRDCRDRGGRVEDPQGVDEQRGWSFELAAAQLRKDSPSESGRTAQVARERQQQADRAW